MMLHFLQVPHQEVVYEEGDGPEFNRDCWFGVKESLGLDFPNLPYLVDGDTRISESTAIYKYIAEKYRPEWLGQSVDERAVVNMVFYATMDVKHLITNTCYDPRYSELIQAAAARARPTLERLAQFLESRQFILGERLSFADFVLYEVLDMVSAAVPGLLVSISPVFDKFAQDFRGLAELEDYLKAPRLPFNNKRASFK